MTEKTFKQHCATCKVPAPVVNDILRKWNAKAMTNDGKLSASTSKGGAHHRPDKDREQRIGVQGRSLFRGGLHRSSHQETSEALFLTSGFVYDTAEEAEGTGGFGSQ